MNLKHIWYSWKVTTKQNITMKNVLEKTKIKAEKEKTKILNFLYKIASNFDEATFYPFWS